MPLLPVISLLVLVACLAVFLLFRQQKRITRESSIRVISAYPLSRNCRLHLFHFKSEEILLAETANQISVISRSELGQELTTNTAVSKT